MNRFKLQSIIFVLVAFMLGCNEFIVVGVLSDLSRTFDVKLSTIGYLVTIFATVYAISTPLRNRFDQPLQSLQDLVIVDCRLLYW